MTVSLARLAAANRNKILANLAGRTGIVYLKGNPSTTRKWTDTDTPHRQESFFFYATGCKENDYHFTLDLASKKATLFMPKFSDDHALWSGTPPTAAEVQQTYAVDAVLTTDQLDGVLAAASVVHVLDKAELPASSKTTDEFLRTAMTNARVIKSDDELALMRIAAKISGEAHIELMKAVRPGQGSEREMHALFEYSCFRKGAPVQAYMPIVAVGRGGAVLHYGVNDKPIDKDPNQLLLVDAACEYNLYASDITRTFPLGGKFNGDFKTTYEIVLEAQKVVLDTLKAGVEWEDMHRLAAKTILHGLVKAGLVHGPEDELVKNHIAALFFPHGLGHLIGIDVHDCGGYPAGVERIQEPGIRYLRMRRTLLAGMVVTVEPGVYFVDAILDPALADPNIRKYLNVDVVERFRRTVGGVRIEDDVVILENGIENLTGWVPKEIADIESVMAH
ncbi:peptidase M24, structural domain-containing protein [Entophlyctis helioformis]|nr:peptidase M24, structural domain-containing protein [Entophlyctis helioformis]KAI8928223.1 peptidase M24, structural domain-containing protein [Entophlyctis helioformis]